MKNYPKVTLPGSLDQQDAIRPLPLKNNVAKLPNGDFCSLSKSSSSSSLLSGNLVQFVGSKFMAPASVEISEHSTENS